MHWLIYLVAFLFTVVGFACAVSVLFSIPGGWCMVLLAVVINLTDQMYRGDMIETFNWTWLMACVVLLLIGEVVEFAAGAAGTRVGGGTKPGMWGALIGGMLGGLLGTFFIPVPVLGSLAGAFIGTFLGAVLGELSHEDSTTVFATLRPAAGATAGRIVGTVAKIILTFVVWLALSVDAWA
ncbi:MAG TPA: DUF456 domain-containing protein [Phycisphaerales bacterium]|nr:DUF456 domain-containing protein [Phycisphaerales bacterium]